jgi:hypothetical protein
MDVWSPWLRQGECSPIDLRLVLGWGGLWFLPPIRLWCFHSLPCTSVGCGERPRLL